MRERGPRVHFLGTGTPVGLRGLHQACILVETSAHKLLIDCGMTALASLGRAGGATIGYSGDAGWSDALVQIAFGADLFICGVWSFDTPEATFVDLGTLLRNRDRLDCRRLVLTHLGPSVLEHLAEVPLEVATDGLTIQL
jgi:ribonuclease BN (tRNA processing enzyme)